MPSDREATKPKLPGCACENRTVLAVNLTTSFLARDSPEFGFASGRSDDDRCRRGLLYGQHFGSWLPLPPRQGWQRARCRSCSEQGLLFQTPVAVVHVVDPAPSWQILSSFFISGHWYVNPLRPILPLEFLDEHESETLSSAGDFRRGLPDHCATFLVISTVPRCQPGPTGDLNADDGPIGQIMAGSR